MASKTIFGSAGAGSFQAGADTVNHAGGKAYKRSSEEALAQILCTGCFGNTFYTSPTEQLAEVTRLAGEVSPRFLTKAAIYARTKGYMKDMPSLALGVLAGRMREAAQSAQEAHSKGQKDLARGYDAEVADLGKLLTVAFTKIVDNGKMLRNFVQVVRSGQAGRKSLGSAPRRLVSSWLESRTPEQLFMASVGNDPSLGDILSLVHPTPSDAGRAAIYGYLLGKEKGKHASAGEFDVLTYCPDMVREYEAFKKDPTGKSLPKAPYEMLEGLALSQDQWVELALRATWQQTRQHLATFERKGVFGSKYATKKIAEKLADREQILRAKAMPYQLLMAYTMSEAVPAAVRNALQDAVEIATENVPVIQGDVAVFPDVSGSMSSPVTGTRLNQKTGKVETHTSKVSCLDVAALVAASVLRKNPEALILPFAETARDGYSFNPKDSIMTNARKLRDVPGGGTNCSAPMAYLNRMGISPDLIWYISDNESWVDRSYGTRTGTMAEWAHVKNRNLKAKLVLMDLTPNTTTQVKTNPNVLNVGGFSDAVFDVVSTFHAGIASNWVEMIENAVELLRSGNGGILRQER